MPGTGAPLHKLGPPGAPPPPGQQLRGQRPVQLGSQRPRPPAGPPGRRRLGARRPGRREWAQAVSGQRLQPIAAHCGLFYVFGLRFVLCCGCSSPDLRQKMKITLLHLIHHLAAPFGGILVAFLHLSILELMYFRKNKSFLIICGFISLK